ncbi:MAG TPA: hypothetical protein VKU82_00055 [Planctomycetaceae bacterium]|nr:hypothetical protein [Planctomycetaceae bacterium]
MSKKARLSRDQKRKQKLAKRQVRRPLVESQAYQGNRYRSEQFVKPLFETELGIYEGYLISERELTDDDVEDDLEALIDALRASPVSEFFYNADLQEKHGLGGYVHSTIFIRWREMYETRRLPARDDLIGIVRTILGSLEVWRSKSASSRGYLSYLDGFMKKMGVSIQVFERDGEMFQLVADPPPDELYEVGAMWLAGSVEAHRRFVELANELLQQGRSEQVQNACQKLLGLVGTVERPEFPILSELSIRAQKVQGELARFDFAPGLKSLIAKVAGW